MPLDNPNYFTGNPLTRLSEKRGDENWFQEQLAHEHGQMLVLYKGKPLLSENENGLAPLWLSPHARSEFPANAPIILMGYLEGAPYFALDASSAASSPETAPFADMGAYKNLREIAHKMSRDDLAIAGQGLWVLDWHRRHRFCANCGAQTNMQGGGTHRKCPDCSADHFPRTDPVAIVLIVHKDACLLGRGVNFPPGVFSALAGFLEPGETLEECAVREVYEEAGVKVEELQYLYSQPWPFPSSLMTGFIAKVGTREFTLDTEEIAEAIWLTKDEARAILDGDLSKGVFVPPKFAIAHQLLKEWVEG